MRDRSAARQGSGSGELALTAVLLLITIVATLMLGRDIATSAISGARQPTDLVRIAIFSTILLALVSGNLVYLVSRVGYLARKRDHREAPLDELIDAHWQDAEPIAVLVPSYKEDERTIRQTLVSAALQHHPNLSVTLLLDDPANPRDRDSARQLAMARRMPDEVADLISEPRVVVERAAEQMRRRIADGGSTDRIELTELLHVFDTLVLWTRTQARRTPIRDHTDAHFVSVTWHRQRDLLERRARHFAAGLGGDLEFSIDTIRREYARLRDAFTVNLSVFQRKRYRNLSHEPNKAANLNAYIDLLGETVAEVPREDGLHLERGSAPGATTMPDATYVLTLDADSMLDPEYALRLSSVFETPGNERVAVVQTPYSAIPHAPGALERIAGATTDIQYVIHQGFTWCRATFWVGANALLRKRALEEIRTETVEGGLTVPRYIQDRTVIEDTESTVDLASRGWDLHNVPVRMAWSATPPDFGSLLIQRSRWANGGLLILPKLVRHLVASAHSRWAIPSFLVRMHYLTSIATGSLGLLVLLVLPFDVELKSGWLYVLPLPYFVAYGRDLVGSGYRIADLPRVFALNLMLVPLHLAGVVNSLHQAITGERIPFGRTPKVSGRTAAPRWAVIAIWSMLAWCLLAMSLDAVTGRWFHAAITAVTAAALLYAVTTFIGVRASIEDTFRGMTLPWTTARSQATRIGDGPAR